MSKKQTLIIIILSAIIICCYVIAGFFSHPCADDFAYAHLGQSDNIINTILNERERWNGRYLSNFLVILSPLNWGGITAYQLMPLALIGFIIIGTYIFFKNILKTNQLLLTLVSTVFLFSVMPDITEGIYWYTGAWTYIPGGVLLLVGISMFLKVKEVILPIHILLISVIFIIASGFNELISVIGIISFTIYLIIKRISKVGVYFLVLFIALLIYIMLAPGNSVRASNFPNKQQLFYSLTMSCAYTARFIGEWLLNPALILWGIIIVKLKFNQNVTNNLNQLKKPIVIITLLITPTYISCFGPIWSTGLLGQYRTANLACYFFILSYTLVLVANKEFLAKKLNFVTRFKPYFILFLIFFIGWKNQYFLYKELLDGTIIQYDRELEARYQLINNCNQSVCEVPAISNKSKTLFLYPLSTNPDYWMNVSYQLYFNSGKIAQK